MAKRARKVRETKPKASRFIRTGSCRRCGQCCRMDVHGDEYRKMELKTFDARLEKAIADGHTEPYPLDPACANLHQLRDGTFVCKIYPDRPMGCRTWPTHPNQLRLVKGCAFQFQEIRPRRTKTERKADAEAIARIVGEGPPTQHRVPMEESP